MVDEEEDEEEGGERDLLEPQRGTFLFLFFAVFCFSLREIQTETWKKN